MIGELKLIDDKWYIEYVSIVDPIKIDKIKKHVPVSNESFENFILEENTVVEFGVEPITNEGHITEFVYNESTISDDFQIGPYGAYEHIQFEYDHINKFDFETDWSFFAITPAINLNFHGGSFTFEIEWLFFGLYISLFKKRNLE